MADNFESPGNFSIQDTMEMGMGNQELLNNLFETETSTADPDEVKEIVKEIEDPAPAKPKPTASKTTAEEMAAKEIDSEEPKKNLSDFLLGDEDEEEDEPVVAAKKAALAPDDEGDEPAPSNSKFTALSNDLFKLGVFTSEEDEEQESISTPEQFLEKFQAEKKKGALDMVDTFIAQFGQDYQDAFQAIYVKGVNPKDYFGTYGEIVNFADMDLSDESNQVKIVTKALQEQGFEPEDIETEIERFRNYGDLESVSAKHHKVLVKKEATKLQELENNAEAVLQQKQAVRNQYINNVNDVLTEKLKSKEFDGIPLNPKIASELQDFLLVDKYKTNSGETLTDFDKTILDLKRPENHATKVKLGLLLKLLEKDPTLSTIQRTGVTKKTDTLFGEVAKQVEKTIVKDNKKPATSWFS